MHKIITSCRLCKSTNLHSFLNLNTQVLTGQFPYKGEDLPVAPIELVWCENCSAVQLRHSVTPTSMFNTGYGYASSLNKSMVDHLKDIYNKILNLNILSIGDTILDIACNDGTFLNFFDATNFKLIGIDPSSEKYKQNFNNTNLVVDFFSAGAFNKVSTEKAKVVTTMACFYDLDNPIQFAKEVKEVLDTNGVWFLEMAYLPLILTNLAYDGCCHEHLLYYSLANIQYIADKSGFKLLDVGFNNINGGSFWVTLSPTESTLTQNTKNIEFAMELESKYNLKSLDTFVEFERKVSSHKRDLRSLLTNLKEGGNTIGGLGASTKFNVLLQAIPLDKQLITAIGDINPYKYGRVTPGTNIQIIPEAEVLDSTKFNYLVVGPYHFKQNILNKDNIKEYLNSGGHLIFPLPIIEVI